MFSDQFKKITGIDCDIVSTIDHPYICPPIRLLDSHRRLYELNKTRKVCILNWDVSQPNDRTYRYDLQIDLGFIVKNKNLYIFDEGTPYALQTPKTIDMKIYDEIMNTSLTHLLNQKILSKNSMELIYENYSKLKDKVLTKVISSSGELTDEYTKRLLIHIYSILHLPNISDFIKENYLYYFKSPLMNKWIPYCLDNAIGGRSFENVYTNNVFGRKVFRSINNEKDDKYINNLDYFVLNKKEIINLVRKNKIIPSVEILYWSLELAGKSHFGNDYGFFERYQKYLNKKLPNQITSMGSDGINIFQMKKDYGVAYNIDTGKFMCRNISSQVKSTRINSMFAFYNLLGEKMAENITRNSSSTTKTVEIIDGVVSIN